MNDNEFLLLDRLGVIRDTINKYGEENFYLSFSGGKDSTVLHHLLDMALPDNKIPRVFIDTGIEYNAIREFVKSINDDRIVFIRPNKNIRQTLEKVGYPFKSKEHARKVHEYQVRYILKPYLERYVYGEGRFSCPSQLRYQFTEDFKINISDNCCRELKKKPVAIYERETGRYIGITGMRASEGGSRIQLGCITTKGNKVHRFNPLIKVNNKWEQWFINEYNIELCRLYYPPYNFERTGCKGCPFNPLLESDLATMSLHKDMISERNQCEIIWKPVYDEYRRIGYRLKKEEQLKLL